VCGIPEAVSAQSVERRVVPGRNKLDLSKQIFLQRNGKNVKPT
jgi:hypothetical protein